MRAKTSDCIISAHRKGRVSVTSCPSDGLLNLLFLRRVTEGLLRSVVNTLRLESRPQTTERKNIPAVIFVFPSLHTDCSAIEQQTFVFTEVSVQVFLIALM